MVNARLVGLALAVMIASALPGALAHEDGHVPSDRPEALGEVTFPVTCNAAARTEFNRAMAMFHSFWFDPARESFSRVLEHDPACAMAHWGTAIAVMGNPFAWPPSPGALETAAAATSRAEKAGGGSDRERDYIAALAEFFRDHGTADHRTRAAAFGTAMEELAERYPEDIEAQILHALVLNALAIPTDKTFSRQLKAAAILEPLFSKYPAHPGVAHYLIHTYDYAELAERGLPAARAYAAIAPSVPHALHMPTHIFSRVGLWPEMVEGNRRSYGAARGELSATVLGTGTYDALHALDYLVFGHLQQAQDRAAKQRVDEVASIREIDVENFVAAYAFAAIPARFALERGDWAGAAGLTLSPRGLAWHKFPQAEAILVFARALGAARSGDAAAAHRDLQRLHGLREAMASSGIAYWAGQADFQIMTLEAWIALSEGRKDEALQSMRAAAEAEEASDKHPVTPGNVVPSRELLGEMLMLLDRPAQAFDEFERSLERDPNRFRGIYGAAHAAEVAGNEPAAREYYAKLQRLTAEGDTERPEIVRSRGYPRSQ